MNRALLASLAALILAVVARADLAPAEQPTPDHRSERIVAALSLSDPAVSAQVLEVLSAHAVALRSFHAQHDSDLKKSWATFTKTRGGKDPVAAAAALSAIDKIYLEFKPEHDAFLAKLGAKLTPAQVIVVKDRLVEEKASKYDLTFHTYRELFPKLTEAQSAFIASRLSLARDEAMDGQSSAEKAMMFKRHKDEIEAYLKSQGYDVKGAYYEFGQKQLKEKAARPGRDEAEPDKKDP